MRCPTCHGLGYLRGPGLAWIVTGGTPCPECLGSGYTSCCDAAGSRALGAYRDDTFPERKCDYCGKLYRGPAVYCSLPCAVADA